MNKATREVNRTEWWRKKRDKQLDKEREQSICHLKPDSPIRSGNVTNHDIDLLNFAMNPDTPIQFRVPLLKATIEVIGGR